MNQVGPDESKMSEGKGIYRLKLRPIWSSRTKTGSQWIVGKSLREGESCGGSCLICGSWLLAGIFFPCGKFYFKLIYLIYFELIPKATWISFKRLYWYRILNPLDRIETLKFLFQQSVPVWRSSKNMNEQLFSVWDELRIVKVLLALVYSVFCHVLILISRFVFQIIRF